MFNKPLRSTLTKYCRVLTLVSLSVGIPGSAFGTGQSGLFCRDAGSPGSPHSSLLGFEKKHFDASDQLRLWEFLKYVSYLVSNFSYSWDQSRPIALLNVAAGIAPENYLYSLFFGSPAFLDSSPGATVWSIEKDSLQVQRALDENQLIQDHVNKSLAESVRIFQGDATDPRVFEKVPPIDVLIIRHPNAGEDGLQKHRGAKGWQPIFENAFSKLSPGGIAIITFYFPKERGMISRYWRDRADLKVIGEEGGVNPYSDGLHDRFYVILTKVKLPE